MNIGVNPSDIKCQHQGPAVFSLISLLPNRLLSTIPVTVSHPDTPIYLPLPNSVPNSLVIGKTNTLANHGVAHTLRTNLAGKSAFVIA